MNRLPNVCLSSWKEDLELFPRGIGSAVLSADARARHEDSEPRLERVEHPAELSDRREVGGILPVLAFAHEVPAELRSEVHLETFH